MQNPRDTKINTYRSHAQFILDKNRDNSPNFIIYKLEKLG